MSKSGADYISSYEKRAFELSIVGAGSPVFAVAGLSTAALLARKEGIGRVMGWGWRSIYPGEEFRIRKFGDPEKNSPLLALIRKAMLDELPQTMDVVKGDLSLIGPRAVLPEHLGRLVESMTDTGLRSEWLASRAIQKPGILSSYSIFSHGQNLGGLAEHARFYETEALRQNANFMASCDLRDIDSASICHDAGLLISAGRMALANYGKYAQRLLGSS